MTLFSGNSLWYLIAQSDAMSKGVLLILLALSIACWAVFLCKFFLISSKKRQLAVVLKELQHVQSVDQLIGLAQANKGNVAGYFLSKNLTYLKSLLSKSGTLALQSDSVVWEKFQAHLDQTIDVLVVQEESYVSLLSTSAGVSPLLGLFGTVWGLVHSFIRISEKQSADIATVAPGLSEALITTLAGLMVAIPAMVMYNIVVNQVKKVEYQLVDLADATASRVQELMTNKEIPHDSFKTQTQTSGFAQ
jgi:biopolymer transport protein TolQ